MSSNSVLTYGTNTGVPSIGMQVTYFLSQEEYNRYGVQSATATVWFVHTPLSVDLITTFTSKGANPGQTVNLSPLNVSYGTSQRNWCEPLVASGTNPPVLPKGSPW